jgi:hypothetical protein
MYIRGFDCNSPLTLDKYKDFKKKGYSFVGRYYTNAGVAKLLTKRDAENISKAGLKIVAVFETSPTNPEYFTYDKGKCDLLQAAERAAEVGQPEDSAIYFAVNFGALKAHLPLIGDYFKGICDEMKTFTLRENQKHHWSIGVYGSYPVVNYISSKINNVSNIWQTYSWSYGKIHSNCNIYQYKNNTNILGVNINNNRGKTTRTAGFGGFSLNR